MMFNIVYLMPKPAKKKKDEFISVRVESTVKDKLLKIAEKNDRPMSWVVNKILVEYVSSDKPKVF
jgi:predicted transcriptional regulator